VYQTLFRWNQAVWDGNMTLTSYFPRFWEIPRIPVGITSSHCCGKFLGRSNCL